MDSLIGGPKPPEFVECGLVVFPLGQLMECQAGFDVEVDGLGERHNQDSNVRGMVPDDAIGAFADRCAAKSISVAISEQSYEIVTK